MPTSPLRNLLYQAALPVLAPSPRGQMTHIITGQALQTMPDYERLLCRHHALGSSLLLRGKGLLAQVDTSVAKPLHTAGPDTLYRVASITKMATALVTLMLAEDGLFTLDTPVAQLLPDASGLAALHDVTVRHLLSHTSGLQDIPAVDTALRSGDSFHAVLQAPDIRFASPGTAFRYCNFAFGLLGCVLEAVTGLQVDELYRSRLFEPLGMDAAMDATTLNRSRIMPISRVLPYHAGTDVTVTKLGSVPLTAADPIHHFGHTAGSLYTNAPSLAALLSLIMNNGEHAGHRLLKASSVAEMTREHATYGTLSPGMRYGLGLVLLQRDELSTHLLIGHQGFAYGCANGAFYDAEDGSMLVFINGGCSEARTGRLGLCCYDLLHWALQKELPLWK